MSNWTKLINGGEGADIQLMSWIYILTPWIYEVFLCKTNISDYIKWCSKINHEQFTSVTPRAMQTAPTHTRFFNRKSLIAQIQPWGGAHSCEILSHLLTEIRLAMNFEIRFPSRPLCVLSMCPVHNPQSSPRSTNLARPCDFPSPRSWTSQCSCLHHSSRTVTWFIINKDCPEALALPECLWICLSNPWNQRTGWRMPMLTVKLFSLY